MEQISLDEALTFIMRRYSPLETTKGLSWAVHSVPFWSNPAKRQVGLRLVCYRSVRPTPVYLTGFVLRQVEAFVMGIVTGIGIEEIGLVGGSGFAPVDHTSTVLGKAQTLHGVAGGPDTSFVGNMQVNAAKSTGNPVALYHAIKAGGKVLMEAIVRIDPITSGERILIHGVRDAAHAGLLQTNIGGFEVWPQTKHYWVYRNGSVYENGTLIGQCR